MRLVLASLLVLAACDGGDGYPEDTSAVIVMWDCPGEESTVDTVSYVGTDMTVTASYGGCEATRQWVCWNGLVPGSGAWPPQLGLHVFHKPAGECDALQSSTLTFSLSPVVDDRDLRDLSEIIFFVGGHRVDWLR